MGLMEKLRGAVFQEDGVNQSVVDCTQVGKQTYPLPTSLPLPTITAADDDRFYSGLVQHTDWLSQPNLQKVFAFAKPLESVIPDRALRLRAAFAQAMANGVTKEGLLSDIRQCMDSLDKEVYQFNLNAETKQKDLGEKENQLRALTDEIVNGKTRLTEAKRRFESAKQRRLSELQQVKEEFANITK